ncbi:MAG: PKD domain-containing protein [Bacteroidota bacterium]
MLELTSSWEQTVPPVANAGADKTVQLPTSSLSITGTGTDSNGTISGYSWTKVSGGAATLSNATTSTLSVSGLVAGTYVFRLTVTDNSGLTGSDDVTVTVNSGNIAPVANAGPDKTIAAPLSTLTLTGSGTDADGTIASYAWTKQSGGLVTLLNTLTNTLSLTALIPGTYVFRLTVVDNLGATSYDDVTVTVTATSNQPPTVNAGNDQSITLPTSSVTLPSTASDAGGSITAYSWTKQSGPAATMTNANTATLSASSLTAGTYVFRETVTDNGGLTAYDEVTVIVNAAPSAPVVVLPGKCGKSEYS